MNCTRRLHSANKNHPIRFEMIRTLKAFTRSYRKFRKKPLQIPNKINEPSNNRRTNRILVNKK